MVDVTEALHYEIRRLRDIVERQYLEIAWQQSELRTRGGKAKIVQFGAGPLGKTALAGNAALLVPRPTPMPEDVWPTGKKPQRTLFPNSGFASYAAAQEQTTAIGISVCGLEDDVVEQVTARVEERLRRLRNFRPLFIMDTTRTEIFRRRGFSYEYLAPCADHERKLASAFAEFTAERLAFIRGKWGLGGIINFGTRRLEAMHDERKMDPRSARSVSAAVGDLLDRASPAGDGALVRQA